MRRTRLSMKQKAKAAEETEDEDSSEDVVNIQEVLIPANPTMSVTNKCDLSESSSESDMETCERRVISPDLASSIFGPISIDSTEVPTFESIEKDIFQGIDRLSDSEEDTHYEIGIGTQNFKDIELYNSKLEAAKKSIEKYETKKRAASSAIDINNLLAAGEKCIEEAQPGASVESSDYETYSDDDEDWQEIKNENEAQLADEVAIKDVQITIEMPDRIAKKKGVDVMAAIKRRINRIKKDQQVYIHKVHLLCWIAHGNYINKVLNQEHIQASALSLLPSQHCYPSNRVDLTYLEQILTWYRKSIKHVEKPSNIKLTLDENLLLQMLRKEASSKNTFVYIFLCVLRSLGINVRLVLNLVLEPLRPPNSLLCSLSNKPSTSAETKMIPSIGKQAEKSSDKSNISASNLKTNKKTESIPSTSTSNQKSSTISSKLSQLTCDPKKPSEKMTTSAHSKLSNNIPSSDGRSKKSNNDLNAKKLVLSIASTSSQKPTLSAKLSKIVLNTSPVNKSDVNISKSSIQKSPSAEISTKSSTLTKRKFGDDKAVDIASKKSSSKTSLSKMTMNVDNNEKTTAYIDEDSNVKKRRASERTSNITSKVLPKPSKSIRKPSPTNLKSFVDCEIIDLSSNRENNNNLKATSSKSKAEVIDSTKKSQSSKLDSAETSSKSQNIRSISSTRNSSQDRTRTKRTSTSKSEADKKEQQNAGKKRKGTVSQVDGPNDSSDDDVFWTIPQLDGNDSSESDRKKPNSKKLNNRNKVKTITTVTTKSTKNGTYRKGCNASLVALKKYNEKPSKNTTASSSSQSSYFSSPTKKPVDVRNDVVNIVKATIGNQRKSSRRQPKSKARTSAISTDDSDSDSDFAPVRSPKKKPRGDEIAPQIKVKRRVLPRKELEKQVHGEDDENEKKKGIDIWIEVYLEAEEKWISVDVLKGQVHCVKELYSRASHPVSYMLGWDSTNYIKDVSQRYCPNWNTVTRKLRVDPAWWSPTLKPFEGPKTARQREEDEELEQQQIDQPLPSAISEYKNHPLYALKRHLLKFEGIYPPDAPTLGFIRKEPVYSRLCVHTLHSREIWVKHAKVVRPGETPYKIVKARPKYDRSSNTFTTDLPLEIFGEWQVDDYVPPTAENGVVPRNAYGNVELFKKCMLPKGTVHIDLPGLNKVARKMNIDCAPAVVGFDFHGGWSHPTFDGYVVCEEFADVLIAAWVIDQEEAEEREREKNEKRVYGNWRKIIKGLLIRERLKKRYDFGAPSTSGKKSKLILKKNRVYEDSSDSD